MESNSQTMYLANDSIFGSELKWRIVETEFYKLLNELRAQKKLQPLIFGNAIIDSASFDQARYMKKHNVIGHEQNNRKKSIPLQRVQYYGGIFNTVGENCILIFIDTPMKTKYNNKLILIKSEKEIAEALFFGWKNSPKHYKNMVTKEYTCAGLGYSFNARENQLYCTQVFGGNVVQK